MTNLKQAVAASLIATAFAMAPSPASAQNPWGFDGRSMEQMREAGRQQTCRSYINEFNVIVGFHNAEKNPERRQQWKDRLDRIRENSRPYNCGLR